LGLGTWDLGLGTWDLGLGTWDLGLGTWDLGLGTILVRGERLEIEFKTKKIPCQLRQGIKVYCAML
jgi:hypothetical protein